MTTTPPTMVMGSLRSEIDHPDHLPPALANLKAVFDRIVNIYRRGLMTRTDAAELLTALIVEDAAGVRWTIGATTRRWYCRTEHGMWKLSTPTASAEDATLNASATAAVERAAKSARALVAAHNSAHPRSAAAPPAAPGTQAAATTGTRTETPDPALRMLAPTLPPGLTVDRRKRKAGKVDAASAAAVAALSAQLGVGADADDDAEEPGGYGL